MRTSIWYTGNDMVAEITGVRSSTMASTAYLNSSTGLRVSVYDGLTTGDTVVVNNQLMSYVAASNGSYRATVQSTAFASSLTVGERAIGIITLSHSGLNGRWKIPIRIEERGTS